MMGLGFVEFLFLVLMLGPSGSSAVQMDALSLVTSEGYLQHRGMEASPGKLLDVLKRPPSDPKSGTLRLVAIRWLGENKAKLGDQAQAAREALGRLASGPPGFDQDYAKIALARLDGKALAPLRTMPKGSVREQALAWLPDDATLFGGIDLRAAPDAAGPGEKASQQFADLRVQMLGKLPADVAPDVYAFLDTVGNVRIDRLALGTTGFPGQHDSGDIYVRVTGQGDVKRLAEFIKKHQTGLKEETRKTPQSVAMHVLLCDQPGKPSMALIGDTDLVVAGPRGRGTSKEALERVLAVIVGKGTNVTKGAFGPALQATPENARLVFMGSFPQELRSSAAQSPLGVAPASVALDLQDAKAGGVDIRLRALFEKQEEATQFVKNAKKLIDEGVKSLPNLPFKIKPESIAALKKTMESVELKAEGQSVTCTVSITPATMQALNDLMGEALKGLR